MLHCKHITSIEQLRSAAPAWDDLWLRSDAAAPTCRAEMLAQWLEYFHPQNGFHAVVVAHNDRWLAALPLVPCRVGWVIPAGGLPNNSWTSCGDLLLDRTSDVPAVLDAMLTAISSLTWPLLWLNETEFESFRWQSFLGACQRVGAISAHHENYRVGRVAIEPTWDAYVKRLRKNHRQGMQRLLRRLGNEGLVQFELLSQMPVQDVEPWLNDAFHLEDRGWKGKAGASVLRTHGMDRFLIAHAEQLAAWGQFEAATLRLDGRMIAFLYGFRAKGVFFCHKIAYDPRFASFSPGQLLFHHLLRQLHEEGNVKSLDFMGPINQSQARWRPATYGIGRIALTPQRWIGRTTMYAYEHWWRPLRNWKLAAETGLGKRRTPLGLEDSTVLEPEKPGV